MLERVNLQRSLPRATVLILYETFILYIKVSTLSWCLTTTV